VQLSVSVIPFEAGLALAFLCDYLGFVSQQATWSVPCNYLKLVRILEPYWDGN